MKPLSAVVGLVILSLGVAVAAQDRKAASPALLRTTFGQLPLYFVENRGVYPDEVAYYIQGSDKTLFFTKDGITFRLKGQDQDWVVKLEFVGANPGVQPRGEDRQQAVFSYFKGPPRDWKTGLGTFSKLVYRDLWPGIDLVYRAGVGALKYEFLVAPGADPAQIRLRYRGASSETTSDTGALRVETPEGSFEDALPAAWQEIDGKRVPVAMAFRLDLVLAGDHADYGFAVGDYDRNQPLVLDPAVLVYCGYIGGTASDCAYSIAVDGAGCAYVTGHTESSEQSFPVTIGPDLTHNGGSADAFVAKVNAHGTALVYCGYIGGSSIDYAYGIAVDAAGSAYVTGYTDSPEQTFPVRIGPDLRYHGACDAFVAQVNTAGTGLNYCGYIGGGSFDYAVGIALDGARNAYIVGCTMSRENSFPVVIGPDLTWNGGQDAFVAKVNTAGTRLVYCGYIGGSRNDGGSGIAVDRAGNACVTGVTESNEQTFPVRAGPDLTFNGGSISMPTDAFVAKVNPSGAALIYCGYLGGNDSELGWSVATDGAGNAYVTGHTGSTEQTFPATIGPDVIFNGGYDAFVAKVTPNGTGLAYCGYLGGTGYDYGAGIAVDVAGNAYITGDTNSSEQTFPVAVGPDLTYKGGPAPFCCDGFVAKVSASGTGLEYCGYIGGSDNDWIRGIAADATGNAYVAGFTNSPEQTFPVRMGPDRQYHGGCDAFVAKIALALLQASGAARPGGTVSFALTTTSRAGLVYQVGSSLGTGPIPVDSRHIDLSPDGLLWISVGDWWPAVFKNYHGAMSATGQAQAAIHIPNLAALIGVRLHTAFVTLDPAAPSGIRSISNTFSFPITQ